MFLMRFHRLWGLFFLMSWLPGTATADPVTLPLEPDWLPYSFVEQNFLPPFYMDHGGWLNGGLLHDVDGDGRLESIDARNPGISCQTINRDHASESLWWYNVPPEFAHRTPCTDISGVWDLTGSGRLEVVLTLSNQARTRWAVERLDARTGALIQHLDLPQLKETRFDREMDTDMFVVGVMDAHMPSGPRRVLILHTRTGHDLQPRGPMALDVETGEVIWQYFTGPKSLLRQAFLLDLENDGTQEIVFSGGVTNNIHEGSYEGLRDDRAHIFCLESDGRLRWRRPMPTTTIHVFLDTLREAGTDTASLVFSTRDLSSTPSQLGVMDARGNIIVTTPLPAGAKTTLARPLADGSFALFTALVKGGLGRWDYHRSQIRERAFVEVIGGNIHLGLAEDFLPENGHELVVSSPGNIWVLDQGLRALAHLHKPESRCYFNGCDRIPFPDGSSIITSRRYSQWPNINFSLTPNPRPFPSYPSPAPACWAWAASR